MKTIGKNTHVFNIGNDSHDYIIVSPDDVCEIMFKNNIRKPEILYKAFTDKEVELEEYFITTIRHRLIEK
jgi:hypothetical protein